MTVKDNKTKSAKVILQPTQVVVEGGSLLAIMGRSGSGKTTLLNSLSGRTHANKLEGVVKFDGKLLNWKERKKLMSYVAQEDTLMGVFTVKETLWYAAAFHYGMKVPEGVVENALDVMGLSNVSDTVVGDIFRKGISGGQKRRLSIAVELISGPEVLFLDEPTSGLDSASALAVISHLRKLAVRMNCAIISTIHQPSSKVWGLFDQFMLMSAGRTLYFGPANQVIPYMSQQGYECPMYTNPADFLLDLVNTDFSDDQKLIVDKLAEAFKVPNASSNISVLVMDNVEDTTKEEETAKEDGAPEHQLLPATDGQTGMRMLMSHFLILSHRNLWNNVKNPGIYWVRFFMYVALSLVIGLMYLNLGDDYGPKAVNSRINVLFFVAAFLVFMSVAVLPFFIQERAVFLRERTNGAYGTFTYVISNFLCSLPGLFIISLFSTICVVLLSGLNGFGVYLLTLFVALVAAESFCALIASLVPHFIVGIALAAGVFGFFMLCEGFFIVKSEIPGWFIWGYYIAFHSYAFRTFMYNEFHTISNFTGGSFTSGDDVLAFYDMQDVVVYQDILTVLAFAVLFQILFALVLYFFHRGKV